MDQQLNIIDVDEMTLPDELKGLIEILAVRVHESWMKQRLSEGWRYGKIRDDKEKTHPCIVPYNQLPESEKAYDHITATVTIKAILAVGYEIRKYK